MKNCISVHGLGYEMKLLKSDLEGFYMYKLIPMDLSRDKSRLIMYISPNRLEHWLYGKPMDGGLQIKLSEILYFNTIEPKFKLADLYDIADEVIELLPNYHDSESEGDDVLRIDYDYNKSIWLYTNGSTDGLKVRGVPSKVVELLKSNGFVNNN